MKTSRTIYLVSYQGPEWNEPVLCLGSEKEAKSHVANLNKSKSLLCNRPFPELSTYTYAPVVLTEDV